LSATATGLNPATSSGFNITPGAAIQLVFGTQPSTTVANHQISPAVKVRALDAFGNVATGFTGAVAIALGSNPGGRTLSGTTSVAGVGGVVTFSDLTTDKAAPVYCATATGLGPATSSSFNITAGTATQLVFGTQPGTTVAGQQITPAVKVRALDALGRSEERRVGKEGSARGRNPGGSTRSGTTPVTAVSGVATFFGRLNEAGEGD